MSSTFDWVLELEDNRLLEMLVAPRSEEDDDEDDNLPADLATVMPLIRSSRLHDVFDVKRDLVLDAPVRMQMTLERPAGLQFGSTGTYGDVLRPMMRVFDRLQELSEEHALPFTAQIMDESNGEYVPVYHWGLGTMSARYSPYFVTDPVVVPMMASMIRTLLEALGKSGDPVVCPECKSVTERVESADAHAPTCSYAAVLRIR